ncbi:SLC13 family permease, partial [Klebsiella pneumoniae]|uniref:SLC13 family permease n=1 Tax=Klebsiella pneumoniae TaxID=573 RepID=UPI00200DBA34
VLILSNRIRPDIVAVLVLLSLGITGILTPEQALAGFSKPAVITIVGLFVITAALERTGVVQRIATAAQAPLLETDTLYTRIASSLTDSSIIQADMVNTTEALAL